MNRILTAFFIILACSQGQGLVYAQTMYKWIDEHGQVHYTSTVPPAAVKHDRRILSKRGRVVKTLEGEKTPEELEAEKQRLEMEALKQKEKEMERQRDKVLLVTYKSEDEILLARDRDLASLNEQILALELRLEDEQQAYRKLTAQAAQQERAGEMASEDVKASIHIAKRNIDEFGYRLEKVRQDKETASLAYQEDLMRFQELRGRASSH